MEEEYIRYRNASFKGKIIIGKKFTKWYFNTYKPMTELESSDLRRSRQYYHVMTAGGAILFGFISFRARRAKAGSMETAGISRENNLPLYILNDAMAGFLGFCGGQFLANDYIYKHRQYVLERQRLEDRLQWA